MNKERGPQGYIALIFLFVFIYGISKQAIGTLITPIIEHYGIKMAQAGLLSSFLSMGSFVAIFIITIFAGRVNKIILMGSSVFLYAVSLYYVSVAPRFGVLLASFALIGTFGSTVDTLTNSLLADLVPHNLGKKMSLMHGIYSLGGLCGPVAIERFSGVLNWAQVYFSISLVFFVFLIIYAAFAKWQWRLLAVRLSNEKQVRFGFPDIVKFFTRKRHVLLWFSLAFYSGNQSTMSIWIKRYVETHLNVAFWGAYALSAMWLGIAISRLLISPNVKASSTRKICVGNFISAIALAVGLLSNSARGIAAASLVVGLSSGLTIPLAVAICCEWHPGKTALGTLMPYTAMFISCVVFPPLSGLVSDFLGIAWGLGVSAACALLTAVFSGILDTNLKQSRES